MILFGWGSALQVSLSWRPAFQTSWGGGPAPKALDNPSPVWPQGKDGHFANYVPGATTTETCVPYSLCFTTKVTTRRSLCTQLESSPHLLQLKKALVPQQRPSAAKNKYILIWLIPCFTVHVPLILFLVQAYFPQICLLTSKILLSGILIYSLIFYRLCHIIL